MCIGLASGKMGLMNTGWRMDGLPLVPSVHRLQDPQYPSQLRSPHSPLSPIGSGRRAVRNHFFIKTRPILLLSAPAARLKHHIAPAYFMHLIYYSLPFPVIKPHLDILLTPLNGYRSRFCERGNSHAFNSEGLH